MSFKQDAEKIYDQCIKLVPNVYIAPPEGQHLEYPCIIIANDYDTNSYANNSVYATTSAMRLTYMSLDETDDISEGIYAALGYTTLINTYLADGVYHQVYRKYTFH